MEETLLLKALLIAVSLLLGFANGQDTCTVGDMETSSTSSTMTGRIFLDINHPAPCSGTVTTWHVCFYEPGRTRTLTEVTALFQIWRPIDGTALYQRAVQVPQTVNIFNFPSSENFECEDISISEDVTIPILESDILGVYIPGFAALNLVSSGLSDENRLQVIDPGPDVDSEMNSANAEPLTGYELHLTADIAVSPDSTTSPFATMLTTSTVNNSSTGSDSSTGSGSSTGSSPSTGSSSSTDVSVTPPLTTDEGVQPAAGLSGGGVAGIVIAMLIIIGAVIAVIVIVFLLWWFKKGRGSAWNKNIKRKSADVSGYDNAIYEDTPVRADSALANYLNSTFTTTSSGPITDYEVPINTKTSKSAAPLPRTKMESMYVAMDGASVEKPLDPDSPDFIDSFETYAASEVDSERYAVQKRKGAAKGGTDSVFNIYRSFGPENELYCQFMEETVSQTGSLPHNVVGYFDPYADPPTDEGEICENLSSKTQDIHHSEIEILAEIGSGKFAFVNKAKWTERKSGVSLTVAVKSLHSPASQEERVKFLQEAAIMGQFVHPNVVRLIGVVKTGDEISLVTEYCAKGDLSLALKQLQSNGVLPVDTPQNLVSYSQQVALAMHYLSSKGFVHRDLAARNIFVTQENICKLGDFGMSRDLANAEYYLSQGGAIPVRWTAPEAIYYSKYSTASDVWSYGCLLFEIWSVGRKPFGGLPNTEVLETIKTGYRLPPPPGCPEAIYNIMIQCWNPETKPRPVFRDILESMLKDDKELLNIPSEDSASHNEATQLGATLDAGKGMYLPLQHTYLTKPPANKRETIYEAIEQFSLDFMPKNSAIPNRAPPLPSSPIPCSPKGPKPSVDVRPLPPATPPPSSRKPPFAKQSSLSTSSQPSSPLRVTKPSVVPKPTPPSSYPSPKPHPLFPPTNKQPIYNNTTGDDIYDDVMGAMPNSVGNMPEAIYDDIAVGNGTATEDNLYDLPPDVGKVDQCDVDYEDI